MGVDPVSLAAISAAIAAAKTAAEGGDIGEIGKSAAIGGATGAVGGAAGGLVGGGLGSAGLSEGLSQAGGAVAGGAVSGAAEAAATGEDIGKGALIGGGTGAVLHGAGKLMAGPTARPPGELEKLELDQATSALESVDVENPGAVESAIARSKRATASFEEVNKGFMERYGDVTAGGDAAGPTQGPAAKGGFSKVRAGAGPSEIPGGTGFPHRVGGAAKGGFSKVRGGTSSTTIPTAGPGRLSRAGTALGKVITDPRVQAGAALAGAAAPLLMKPSSPSAPVIPRTRSASLSASRAAESERRRLRGRGRGSTRVASALGRANVGARSLGGL